MALSAAQSLRGPRLQIQRSLTAGSHHRQVRNSQEDRSAGEEQPEKMKSLLRMSENHGKSNESVQKVHTKQ